MTASGRMCIPKSRFNLLSAEPKGVLTVRILLLGTVNPLAVKTLVRDMGCLVSFKATCGHLSLIPPSLQAGEMLKAPPTGTTHSGDLHLVRVPPAAACPLCLVLAIWNRSFSLGKILLFFWPLVCSSKVNICGDKHRVL